MIIGRRVLKCSERAVHQCHIVNHKSHMDCPEIDSESPSQKSTTNRLSYDTTLNVGLL